MATRAYVLIETAVGKTRDVLGGSLDEVKWLNLPELGEPRALVILKKTSPTPQAYPRRAGMPTKRPIR